MSRRGRAKGRSRRFAAALLLAVGVALGASLAGCATGDAVHGAFVREFANDPAVVGLDLSSADNQPFTGGVGGEVSLRDDVTDAELRAFAERVRAFAADQGGGEVGAVQGAEQGSRVRISALFDGWRIPVLLDRAQGDALIDVASELRGDARVRAATFTADALATAVSSARLEVVDGDAAFALLGASPNLFARLATAPAVTVATLPTSPERVVLAGAPGGWLDGADAAYKALHAELSLTGFEAAPDEVKVTLAREADRDRADAIARLALLDASLPVRIQSDLVTLGPGATGGAARDLLAALPADASGAVESVWTDDRALQLGAAGPEGLAALARAIDAGAGAGVGAGAGAAEAPLRPVTIRTGDPSEPTLSVRGEPGALAAQAAVAVSLNGRDEIARVELQPGVSFELTLRSRPAAADLAAYAEALKPLAVPGDRVCVDAVEGQSFCVIAAPQLTAAELNDRAQRAGGPFIDAWNARP